jgi:hypothetical protein
MSLGTFQVGQSVTITATFKNTAGVVTDPTTVVWRIQHTDGVIQTFALSDLVKVSTGVYTLTFTITGTAYGPWWSRPTGTAGVIAADEQMFVVKRSAFVAP